MTYALIQDGAIVREAHQVPRTGQNAVGEWVTPPDGEWTPEQAAQVGWHPVTDTSSPDDTATTRHERTVEVVDGLPAVVWVEHDKTEQEQANDAEAAARLDDLAARVERIEAHLWPAPDVPADTGDAPTFTGIWPNGGLVLEDGTVYRNVSGVPLTTPPSGFPGNPSAWTRLFVAVLTGAGEPDPEPEPAPQWDKNTTYQVGDIVTNGGHRWMCLIGHGAEYQGTWEPSVNTSTVWQDLGTAIA